MSDLRRIANERHDTHDGRPSSRPLSEDYELVGLTGEQALADFCGGELDSMVRPGGDGGTDCHIALFFTVDVKTARKAFNLLVEAGKAKADIYVLASYDSGTAKLLGWEWGAVVAKTEPRDVGGFGILSHAIPLKKLRHMSELKVRLTKRSAQTLQIKRDGATATPATPVGESQHNEVSQ